MTALVPRIRTCQKILILISRFEFKYLPQSQHLALILPTMLICGIKRQTSSILRGNSARSFSSLHTTFSRAPRHQNSRDRIRLISAGAQISPSGSSYSSYSSDSLSSSRPVMTAQKIDGTAIAKSIREKINASIHQKQQSNPRYKPSLVIIQGISANDLPKNVLTMYSGSPARFQYVEDIDSQCVG